MLSNLQQSLRRLIAELPEAEPFALAGGAALIVRRIVDRPTRDLDLFATSAQDVNRLLPALERALEEAGLEHQVIQASDGFARIVVAGGGETTTVDLAWDARRYQPEPTTDGNILAEDELAADKLLALFGRAAARDFIDVAALVDRHGLDRLCRLASDKDPGFDRTVLRHMLSRIDRLPRADFELTDADYRRLRTQIDLWRRDLRSVRERHVHPERDDPGWEPPSLGR